MQDGPLGTCSRSVGAPPHLFWFTGDCKYFDYPPTFMGVLSRWNVLPFITLSVLFPALTEYTRHVIYSGSLSSILDSHPLPHLRDRDHIFIFAMHNHPGQGTAVADKHAWPIKTFHLSYPQRLVWERGHDPKWIQWALLGLCSLEQHMKRNLEWLPSILKGSSNSKNLCYRKPSWC